MTRRWYDFRAQARGAEIVIYDEIGAFDFVETANTIGLPRYASRRSTSSSPAGSCCTCSPTLRVWDQLTVGSETFVIGGERSGEIAVGSDGRGHIGGVSPSLEDAGSTIAALTSGIDLRCASGCSARAGFTCVEITGRCASAGRVPWGGRLSAGRDDAGSLPTKLSRSCRFSKPIDRSSP
jgi:hypothetical protein